MNARLVIPVLPLPGQPVSCDRFPRPTGTRVTLISSTDRHARWEWPIPPSSFIIMDNRRNRRSRCSGTIIAPKVRAHRRPLRREPGEFSACASSTRPTCRKNRRLGGKHGREWHSAPDGVAPNGELVLAARRPR